MLVPQPLDITACQFGKVSDCLPTAEIGGDRPRSIMQLDEQPTLRLYTLRRLVRRTVPPIIFDHATPIGIVEDVLSQVPSATAVVIDEARVFQGTVRLIDLADRDRTAPIERVMTDVTPILLAEDDIDAAESAMRSFETDRIVVIAPDGELLGVLTDSDLAERRAA